MCQYNNIYASSYKYIFFKSTNGRPKGKKKKNSIATVAIVPLKQIKRTVAFTHSHNKCYNIFTKKLFSIVVDHSFIFYYFILTYKKLTSQ